MSAGSSPFRERVLDLTTVVVCLVTVTAAVLIVFDRIPSRSPLATRQEDRSIEDWETWTAGADRIGPEVATVTIMEFGDYECPFCKQLHERIEAILRSRPQDVALVYRHFPLPYHEHAYYAARLSECAADQGHFAAAHRLLYEEANIASVVSSEMAAKLSLPDSQLFVRCAEGQEPDPRIEADLAAAEELSITAAPAVIINGTYLGSPPDSARLTEIIDSLILERNLADSSGQGSLISMGPFSLGTLALLAIPALFSGSSPSENPPASKALDGPRNQQGLEEWTIVPDPEVTLGMLDGPEEHLLTAVLSGTVLSNGVIVLAQNTRSFVVIRYFDSSGAFVANASGKGDGPGEFQTLLTVIPLSGDSILALGLDQRFAIFDAAGALARTGRLSQPSVPMDFFHLGNRTIAFSTSIPGPSPLKGFHGGSRQVLVTDLDYPDRYHAAGPPVPGNRVYVERGYFNPVPFGMESFAAAGGGRVWIGRSDRTEVRGYDDSGDLSIVVPDTWPPRDIGRADRRRYREARLSGKSGNRLRAKERYLSGAPFPAQMPAFNGLEVDAAGNLWVLKYSPVRSHVDQEWKIFDSQGRARARLTIPRNLLSQCAFDWVASPCDHILEIGANYILLMHIDPLGVQRIHKYPLEKD